MDKMDSSNGEKRAPNKRSDAQRAAASSNFSKKRKRKKSISRHSEGLKMKSGSYDTKGAAATLGVAPNSQAITSALTPAAEPEPRKPTTEELQAEQVVLLPAGQPVFDA